MCKSVRCEQAVTGVGVNNLQDYSGSDRGARGEQRGWARGGAGGITMLGRSAVSYQNISPSSDIFSGSGNCVNDVLSSNINGTLRNTKSKNR